MKWVIHTIVKLRNGPAKFSCLITSGELLQEGLEKKKLMTGLERESWGRIERGSGWAKEEEA